METVKNIRLHGASIKHCLVTSYFAFQGQSRERRMPWIFLPKGASCGQKDSCLSNVPLGQVSQTSGTASLSSSLSLTHLFLIQALSSAKHWGNTKMAFSGPSTKKVEATWVTRTVMTAQPRSPRCLPPTDPHILRSSQEMTSRTHISGILRLVIDPCPGGKPPFHRHHHPKSNFPDRVSAAKEQCWEDRCEQQTNDHTLQWKDKRNRTNSTCTSFGHPCQTANQSCLASSQKQGFQRLQLLKRSKNPTNSMKWRSWDISFSRHRPTPKETANPVWTQAILSVDCPWRKLPTSLFQRDSRLDFPHWLLSRRAADNDKASGQGSMKTRSAQPGNYGRDSLYIAAIPSIILSWESSRQWIRARGDHLRCRLDAVVSSTSSGTQLYQLWLTTADTTACKHPWHFSANSL